MDKQKYDSFYFLFNCVYFCFAANDVSIASDIETTSYVLLALLHEQSQENLAKAHSVVQWLSSQQGPRGGFKSTQVCVSNFFNGDWKGDYP